VYSLAAVLYCLISLRPPYKGTPTQVLASLATREPEPLEKLRRDVPRDLQAIVEQGMARRPGQRYADASALEADLRAFLEHRPIKARPTGPLRRSLRRVRDSRSLRGAAAALVIVLLVSVGVSVRNSVVEAWKKQAQAELDQRSARTQELYLQFPPNMGIGEFQNRRVHRESDRLALEALLDEAVENCVDPFPVVLLRAVHRHDHGDVRGAERDMVSIALHEGTELATAIAQAYQALPDDSDSSRDLVLAGLPEPATDRDRYLLGYLHLRNWEDAAGHALLESGGSDAVPHGKEILWPLVEFSGKSPEEIRVLGERILGELLLHEEQNGGVSANTAHFRSHIYGRMGAHTEGYRWGRVSVELSPWTHVNRSNLGYNAMLLGRYEEAEQTFHHGLEQQPGYWRLADNYLWCLIAQGRFDFALSETERLAKSERLDEVWIHNRVAGVESYRALSTWLELRADAEPDEVKLGELVAAVEVARAALQAYEAAGAPGKPTTSFALLDALQAGDELQLFEALLEHVKRGRYQPWALNQVLDVFPEALPEGSGALARELLADVVQRLNLSRTGFFNRDVDR
jgi:tetratricopeptide (TPR) repeat protein